MEYSATYKEESFLINDRFIKIPMVSGWTNLEPEDYLNPYGRIYLMKNKINNKVYIGQTVERKIWDRIRGHLKGDRKNDNIPFHNALRKYGYKGFDMTILDYARDKKELNFKEKYWVAWFKSHGYIVYNVLQGGQPELFNGGKKKISVSVYDLSGNFLNTYSSISEVAKKLKISNQHIGNCLKGKRIRCGNYMFRYADGNIDKIKPYEMEYQKRMRKFSKQEWNLKSVRVKMPDGQMLIFNSESEAAKYLNISKCTISATINGRIKKSRNGYNFYLN